MAWGNPFSIHLREIHVVAKMTIVRTKELTKHFYLGETVVRALRGIDIEIDESEFMAIAGSSGSGKSTLLNLIGCIDIPSSGYIEIDGSDVSGLSSNRLAELRASTIGFIFQTFNLLPVLSAFENVEYPLLRKNIKKDERKTKNNKRAKNCRVGKVCQA